MSNEPELKARDKVVLRMTRDGAVEKNLTSGTEQRVSKRLEDAELVKPVETAVPSEALSAEEQKRCRCAVSSISFRRNTPKITTLSRPLKRQSQKRKGQKIHPRMYLNRCLRQKRRSSPLLWSSAVFLLIPAR